MKQDAMGMGRRALLTESERETIQSPESKDNPYVAVSRVRSKIEDELPKDIEILREHRPDLLEDLQDIVCVDTNSPQEGHSRPADQSPIEDGESPEPTPKTRENESPATETDAANDHEATEALVTDVVDAVAGSWDDTNERLEARKDAAKVVLEYAVESGKYIGQSDAVEQFRDQYPVEDQNAETWWKQNARRVLTEVGEYSRGKYGYRVERDDLEEFLRGDDE